MSDNKLRHVLAGQLAALFAALPQVTAVALSGSLGSGQGQAPTVPEGQAPTVLEGQAPTVPEGDSASDIDLYVYTRTDIPLEARRSIVNRAGGASRASLGLTFWGPGDEWIHAATGIEIDIVYFETGWMESQAWATLQEHQAGLGYSTCFCYTIRHSKVFYDPAGWFAGLQDACSIPYPEPLRQNIIALNHPVLRNIIPAYAYQLEKAARRGDLVSINHRLAALFASYFDILFALNRELHPGEKRLVEQAEARCGKIPANMRQDIAALLSASTAGDRILLDRLAALLDHLDELLEQEGFDPQTSRLRIAS